MKTRRSANQAAGGDDGKEERRRAGRAEIWEWWMNDFTSTGFIRTFARTTGARFIGTRGCPTTTRWEPLPKGGGWSRDGEKWR